MICTPQARCSAPTHALGVLSMQCGCKGATNLSFTSSRFDIMLHTIQAIQMLIDYPIVLYGIAFLCLFKLPASSPPPVLLRKEIGPNQEVRLQSDFAKVFPLVLRFWYGLPVPQIGGKWRKWSCLKVKSKFR